MLVLGSGLLIHLTSHSSAVEITLIQIVTGCGAGLSYSGPLLALQAHVDGEDTATATATLGFARNMATAVAVVVGGVVFQNGMESQAAVLKAGLGEALAGMFSGKEAAANVVNVKGLDEVQRVLVKAAYAASLRRVWVLFTCTVCSFSDSLWDFTLG